jgi:hypothetical protein
MNQMCEKKKQPTKEDVKKMQLEIDKLTITNKMIKKNIMKFFAKIRSIKNGNLTHEKNKFRIKAFHAHIEKMEAQIDGGYLKIEINNFKKITLQNQLDKILAVEPEPIVRREQLPPRASRDSPPLMVPPEMPRTAGR